MKVVNIDQHKDTLIRLGADMFNLCAKQLENSIEAFFYFDRNLAENVIHREYKLNALDLKIDRNCEQFLVLHKPVASDLRFVSSLRKINPGLENIGDCAFGIAKFALELNAKNSRGKKEQYQFC